MTIGTEYQDTILKEWKKLPSSHRRNEKDALDFLFHIASKEPALLQVITGKGFQYQVQLLLASNEIPVLQDLDHISSS